MKNNFFKEIKKSLTATTPQKKIELFEKSYKEFLDDKLELKSTCIEFFLKPSYSDFCTIVDQREVPQRKNLASDEGKAILLHAIAHIEYSAIDLALDACYRFQDMPYEFYKDWMEVADDEIRHFLMINEYLETFGLKYGDLPVHKGLFEACMKTTKLIPRMALIPRYMEANGLDANAMMIEKLNKIPNSQKLIDLLQIILDEEIAHVKKGDKWYKYGCSLKKDFACDYFQIVNSIYPNSFNTNKNVNVKARKEAGFSDEEIEKLLAQ